MTWSHFPCAIINFSRRHGGILTHFLHSIASLYWVLQGGTYTQPPQGPAKTFQLGWDLDWAPVVLSFFFLSLFFLFFPAPLQNFWSAWGRCPVARGGLRKAMGVRQLTSHFTKEFCNIQRSYGWINNWKVPRSSGCKIIFPQKTSSVHHSAWQLLFHKRGTLLYDWTSPLTVHLVCPYHIIPEVNCGSL